MPKWSVRRIAVKRYERNCPGGRLSGSLAAVEAI